MAFYNEAWFIHQVSDNVTHLAQQRQSKTTNSTRRKDGVVGKTWPFNTLSSYDMEEMDTRDADTTYLNPTQGKRRASLRDFGAAVLIDSFDDVKTLTSPESEFAYGLAYARNRKEDDLIIGIDGRTAAAAAGAGTGGALGKAIVVNEGAETATSTDIPTAQQIVNGGTNLTMAKVRSAKEKFDTADAPEEDRYFFTSPVGMRKLLEDNTVTSSDFNTIQALVEGRLPPDAMWMGFKWRMSTRLFKSGNIRQCIAYQKMGVGYATSPVKEIQVNEAPHKWNNPQAVAKLSGGAVRIDDNLVVQIDIDESA